MLIWRLGLERHGVFGSGDPEAGNVEQVSLVLKDSFGDRPVQEGRTSGTLRV